MHEISFKNSERLLRKWQKTLGDTFFATHCSHLVLSGGTLCNAGCGISVGYVVVSLDSSQRWWSWGN